MTSIPLATAPIGADHRKGLAITAFGGLMLTADIPLIRLTEGDAWSVLAVRSALTFAAALAVWLLVRVLTGRRLTIVPGPRGLAVMACYGLSSITFMLAVFSTTTANLVFMLALNPMFSALLSWAFLGERPRGPTFLAMAAMVAGVSLIVAEGIAAGHLWGDMAAFASSFILATAITISRSARTDMGFAPLFATIVPALIGLAMVGGPSGLTLGAPWWIVLNGFVVIPIAFWCLATGPKYLSGPEVAMFYLLETILAPIWVWMIFAEAPSNQTLLGGAIMIVALVAHSLWQLSETRRLARARIPRHPV